MKLAGPFPVTPYLSLVVRMKLDRAVRGAPGLAPTSDSASRAEVAKRSRDTFLDILNAIKSAYDNVLTLYRVFTPLEIF